MSEARTRYLNMSAEEYSVVRNVLTAALESLGPEGERWVKNAFITQTGSRCMMGAVEVQDTPMFSRCDADLYLKHAIHMRTGKWLTIPHFNDALTTSFSDVKAVFEGALFQLDSDAKV